MTKRKNELKRVKEEPGSAVFRFLALYEEERFIPASHVEKLTKMAEKGFICFKEDKATCKKRAVLTEKGQEILRQRRLLGNPLFFTITHPFNYKNKRVSC